MSMHTAKIRIDQLLVERGLAESREKAQALIIAGEVVVNGQKALKPGHSVAADSRVEVLERMPYVSRGGYKLAGALDHWALDVTGWICLDVGASTGGFTDCLLQRGRRESVGHRCRPWTDRLEIAQRSARGGSGRRQCALPNARRISRRSSTWRYATPASSPSRLLIPAVAPLLTPRRQDGAAGQAAV